MRSPTGQSLDCDSVLVDKTLWWPTREVNRIRGVDWIALHLKAINQLPALLTASMLTCMTWGFVFSGSNSLARVARYSWIWSAKMLDLSRSDTPCSTVLSLEHDEPPGQWHNTGCPQKPICDNQRSMLNQLPAYQYISNAIYLRDSTSKWRYSAELWSISSKGLEMPSSWILSRIPSASKAVIPIVDRELFNHSLGIINEYLAH